MFLLLFLSAGLLPVNGIRTTGDEADIIVRFKHDSDGNHIVYLELLPGHDSDPWATGNGKPETQVPGWRLTLVGLARQRAHILRVGKGRSFLKTMMF